MTWVKAGFNVVRKQHWLWLLPVVFSLGMLLVNMLFLEKWALPDLGFLLRVTIRASIPEIDDVIPRPNLGSTLDSFGVFVLALAISLLKSLLTAGYLAGGLRALRDEEVDMPTFWADCQHFFLRLLLIGLLWLLVSNIASNVLELVHPLVSSMVGVVTVIYLFFWEIAIVYEDLGLLAGFMKGLAIMCRNLGEVIRLLITIFLTSGVMSLLLNRLAQYYLGYLLAILVWSFIGASLYIAVLHCYSELEKRGAPDALASELT